MIENDNQMDATLERISHFAKVQASIRKTASSSQFESMSSGYLSEIKKMHDELIEYLSRRDGSGDQDSAVETGAHTDSLR